MSAAENEIRERRGKAPDFPWKDEELTGTNEATVREHDSGESVPAPGDTRLWGSEDSADDQEFCMEETPREPDAGSDDTEKASARKKTGPLF
ncbi:MAG: hypothetical protein OK474_09905 [Thaumarchaeota archaeon]|nr:hypothetical protein [Nitrososphaerota archaeon]